MSVIESLASLGGYYDTVRTIRRESKSRKKVGFCILISVDKKYY